MRILSISMRQVDISLCQAIACHQHLSCRDLILVDCEATLHLVVMNRFVSRHNSDLHGRGLEGALRGMSPSSQLLMVIYSNDAIDEPISSMICLQSLDAWLPLE